MKNSQVSLILLLLVGLSTGACNKKLNVYPTTSDVDGNVIIDRESAQDVLNGVYFRLANAGKDSYTGYINTIWSAVNEQLPTALAGSIVYPGGSRVDSADLVPNGYAAPLIWKYGYNLVNAANGFIKNIVPLASIPAAVKRQMLAEAKFLRAFGNSELLLYYGQYNDPSSKYGIILRDTFVTTSNLNQPRSGVAAAYTSILSDLDSVINGLPVLNTAIYYANASDAKLLKARVLMNRGAAGDYGSVISLTNDVITNGPFVLEDSLKDIFLSKGFSSKEVMLGIQPYPNDLYKYEIYNLFILQNATDSLISLLADDARNQWIYKYTHNYYFSDSVYVLAKYYSGDPGKLVKTPLSVYSYAFRLSEAYLLEAEAITLSTGDLAAAKILLTTVMSHAGAGPSELAAVAAASTPAAVQLEIVKEYLRNFVAENGVDWFALRRLPFAALQKLNPNILHPSQLILPIPTIELNYNNVTQNPGY